MCTPPASASGGSSRFLRSRRGGTLLLVLVSTGSQATALAAIARFQEAALAAEVGDLPRVLRSRWRSLARELDLAGLAFRPRSGTALETPQRLRVDERWLAACRVEGFACQPAGQGARWGGDWLTSTLGTVDGRIIAVGAADRPLRSDCLEHLAASGAAACARWEESRRLARACDLAAVGARAGGRLHDLRNQLTLALFHADRAGEPDARAALLGDLRLARELAGAGLAGDPNDDGRDARLMRRVPLRAVLLEEARALAATARTASARVRVRCPSALEVLGDSTALGRLARNLLTNAAEARAGGARVRVEARRTSVDHLELSVADDGRGMSAEALDGYLDAGRTIGGSGFGTASVADALERLEASLVVASAPGRGTRIQLELWAAPRDGTRTCLVVDPVPGGRRSPVLPRALDADFDVAPVRVQTPTQALSMLEALRPERVELARAAIGQGRKRLRRLAARMGVPLTETSSR